MTRVRLLTGNSSAVRLDAALAVLRDWGPCLVLAPQRTVADELVWRLAEEGSATSGVQRTTPGLMAAELAARALAEEGRATVGETAARAVLAQAVETAAAEQKLAWFSDVAELPGFVPSLQETLQELRLAGVSSALLRAVFTEKKKQVGEDFVGFESEQRNTRAHLRLLEGGLTGQAQALLGMHGANVLEELAQLLGRYESGLENWGLADGPWVTARAIEVLVQGSGLVSDTRPKEHGPEEHRAGEDRAGEHRTEEHRTGEPSGEESRRTGTRRKTSQEETTDDNIDPLPELLLAPWRNLPQLWLDVPMHSVLAREFFAAASALAPEVAVVAPSRDRQTLQAISSHLTESQERCGVSEEVFLDGGEEQTAQGAEPRSRLWKVQENVFASAVSDQEAIQQHDDSFEFFSAAGEGQEAVEIARRIGVLAEQGVPFDEMAILVRQPSVHGPLIEDALSRAEIPGYFARGTARPDPSGRAFLSLLACAEDGLSATRFAEFLSFDQLPQLEVSKSPQGDSDGPSSPGNPGDGHHGDDVDSKAVEKATSPERSNGSTKSPQFTIPWVTPDAGQLVLSSLVDSGKLSDDDQLELSSTPVFHRPETGVQEPSIQAESLDDPTQLRRAAPSAWERLIVDASVVGGSDRWRRRLKGLACELERHAQSVAGDDEPRARALRARIRRLGDLREFAVPIIEQLEDLPEGRTWAHWLQALEQLAVAALRWPKSVLKVLAELRPMGTVKRVTLRQVQKILEQPLRSMEAEPPRRRHGRVFIAPIEQARGRSFRIVFVPGLAEGVFPAKAMEDPLLLDRERRRVASVLGAGGRDRSQDLGSELVTQSLRFHRERLLMRLAIGAACDRLVVSYSRIDVMLGRARVPSFYALDLLRAAEGSLPTLASLERRAASQGDAAGVGAIWPAPEKPEDAIDDAEFDLALLHPQQKEAGAARFLLFANPHLERSLNARARRWRRPFTWADGLVLEEPAKNTDTAALALSKELLAAQRPSVRSFSPTALQNFSACPYRFLLQAVHRLRPLEDRTGFEQLDPLTRGSLFHDTQFFLFAKLRDLDLLPVTASNLAEVLDHADRVLDETAARTYEEMAPAIDRIWAVEVESLRNDLRGWLRQVSETPSWRPVAAELAFGLTRSEDRDPMSVERPINVDGFLLRGSIDLVEVSERLGRVRVTDHKTGRAYGKPSMVIEGGQVLQPVLYALVMEQMMRDGQVSFDDGLRSVEAFTGEGVDVGEPEGNGPSVGHSDEGASALCDDVSPKLSVDSGRLFFCTTRGGYSEVEVPLGSGARRSAEQLLETVDAHIRDGFLPAAPSKGACRFCDYALVCGPYEERRVQRKRRDRLEALERLRGLR